MSDKPQLEGEVFYPSPRGGRAGPGQELGRGGQARRRRPRGLLGRRGRRARVVPQVGQGPRRLQEAALPLVQGRAVQHHPQRPRPPPAHLAQEQALAHLGRRAQRGPHLLVLRPQPRRLQVRQRPEGHGREEGRARHHLHAAHPRDRHRHAGLRQDRRDPHGGLRRLLGGRPAGAHRGLRVQGGGHRRRRLHERQGGRAQEDRRRRRPQVPHRGDRHRGAAHRPRDPHGGRARLLVPRAHEAPPRHGQLPDRGHGRLATRSTSSTPRGPPGSPRGWSTATAAT